MREELFGRLFSMSKKTKILIGLSVVVFGILGFLIGPYFILTLLSLVSLPSGLSLIISAVI